MAFIVVIGTILLELIALSALSRRLSAILFRGFGRTPYLFLLWPGVIVHEFSHWFACRLTRTKVFEVRLFAPREESGALVLGHVSHEKAGKISETIIGAAPFFGGAVAIRVLLGIFAGGSIGGLFLPPSSVGIDANVGVPAIVSAGLRNFYGQLLAVRGHGFFWSAAFLYFLTAFSAQLAPSRTDLRHSAAGLAISAAAAAVIVFFGTVFFPNAGALLAAAIFSAAAAAASLLGVAAACVAALIIFFRFMFALRAAVFV